jgi:hypothetical protein
MLQTNRMISRSKTEPPVRAAHNVAKSVKSANVDRSTHKARSRREFWDGVQRAITREKSMLCSTTDCSASATALSSRREAKGSPRQLSRFLRTLLNSMAIQASCSQSLIWKFGIGKWRLWARSEYRRPGRSPRAANLLHIGLMRAAAGRSHRSAVKFFQELFQASQVVDVEAFEFQSETAPARGGGDFRPGLDVLISALKGNDQSQREERFSNGCSRR